ncbi:MAG TPA: hypothetical protein VGH35_00690 [Gaiellaceae bacterium]|jgi:hypothetical protein
MRRAAVWAVLGACVVLATRAVVYALAPWQTVAVLQLEHKAGGPHLALVLGVGVAVAGAVAAAVLWLAVVAVRERLALEPRALGAPRLSLPRLAVRGVLFFAATSLAFAYLESYLHWRAGLGWHGLHCLSGPVHRDAVPVLGALSLLAVAGHGAVEHLLGWARRLVALLAARLPLLRGAGRVFSSTARVCFTRVGSAASPRGPPFGSPATT